MEIRLSRHARLRLAQRFVDVEDIARTITDPDTILEPPSAQSCTRFRKECAGVILVVAARAIPSGYRVASVYWVTPRRPRNDGRRRRR